MKNIAVFCGSKTGNNELYLVHATTMGKLLATNGMHLVYGGGNKGLMGAVADAAMKAGGQVTGIIPEHLRSWEHAHTAITKLIVVPDMHTRKRKLFELADAAIILPGGYGTMDELFEMLTWNQLALHNKPIVILNTAGYYTDLLQLMQIMHGSGFLYHSYEESVRIFDVPDKVLEYLETL